MQSVSQAQAAAAASVALAAVSSHRPETVGGGSEDVPCGGRLLLQACSKAEVDSGGTGLGGFFLRGMGAAICLEPKAATHLHANWPGSTQPAARPAAAPAD